MSVNRCSICDNSLSEMDLYFEQGGGAVCLACVVDLELPLDLPEQHSSVPGLGDHQLGSCLDSVMGRPLPGPLLEAVECMYEG